MTIDCYCDYDTPTLYKAVVHRTRRDRQCDECGRLIIKGAPYERADGLHDGSWFSCVACEPCLELRQWVQNNVPCFCWEHGNMLENARDAVEAARHRAFEETAGLEFGFGRRLWAVKRAPRPRAMPVEVARG